MLVTSKEKDDLIERLTKYFKHHDIIYKKEISKRNKIKHLYYLRVYSNYNEYFIMFFLQYKFKNRKFFELKITEFNEDLKSDYILFEGILNILFAGSNKL